jgi:hypothetical protein
VHPGPLHRSYAQIAADGKRKIDSIYNIIGSAVFNLGSHVRSGGESAERA